MFILDVQRLVRKRKQVWPSARAQLVSYCNAVVAPVEGICQIRKYNTNAFRISDFLVFVNVFMKKDCGANDYLTSSA